MNRTIPLSAIALSLAASFAVSGAAYASDGKLSLEMLYHPTEKVNFATAPLTRLSWDNQNRLIESKVNKGAAELYVVNPSTWEKSLLPTDGNVLTILKAAKIDEKLVNRLADQLSSRIKPEVKSYIFTYKNDIWLLDLSANKARSLTNTPEQAEDEALLSPNSQSVAYLKGNDMYVVDVKTAKEKRLTTGGSETVFNGRLDWVYQEEVYGRGDFRAFRWAPDSKKLAFLSFDESKVPVYTLSGDHVQPVKTDRTRYPKAGDPNPITKLGVVDLNGKISWTQDPYAGKETLIVQVDWTPDGKLMAAWQDRVQTWLDLRIYDAKLNSQVAVKETSPAWTARLPLPQFLKDGSFIWESDRTGHRHLYL
jgi:dipeptidyl-peptidase-4